MKQYCGIMIYLMLDAVIFISTTYSIASFFGNLELNHGTIRFQMRDAYWTMKRRFKICPIGVVHFEYFRADALGFFQLVPCISFRNSYIGYITP